MERNTKNKKAYRHFQNCNVPSTVRMSSFRILCFLMEIILMSFERDFNSILSKLLRKGRVALHIWSHLFLEKRTEMTWMDTSSCTVRTLSYYLLWVFLLLLFCHVSMFSCFFIILFSIIFSSALKWQSWGEGGRLSPVIYFLRLSVIGCQHDFPSISEAAA